MTIALVDVRAQHAEIADEVEPVVLDLLRSGQYIGGAAVDEFERAYAEMVGAAHCIGVANGTDAIEFALRAVGVGPGDEVIVPANTFIATAEAVSRIGALPVPADVDPEHLLLDPAAVATALTARTRAVVPVHLFGQVAPIDELACVLRDAGVPIVEDAAQAQGARRHGRVAGALGVIAATSLYPGKNLGGAGDGGAVTTSDEQFADHVRLYANHGSRRKYRHEIVGANSRLDAFNAVVLSVKLAKLEEWNERRRAVANRYLELLEGIEGVRLPTSMAGNEDAWHLFVVRLDDRDWVRERLAQDGIEAGVHYPQPWYLSPAYRNERIGRECPVAEDAAEHILSLPIHPHLTRDAQDRVVESLIEAVER